MPDPTNPRAFSPRWLAENMTAPEPPAPAPPPAPPDPELLELLRQERELRNTPPPEPVSQPPAAPDPALLELIRLQREQLREPPPAGQPQEPPAAPFEMPATPKYTPEDWYWHVAGDESRAWSSKAGGYVPAADVPKEARPTRIKDETELREVLIAQRLKGPLHADDVRAEAQRRIVALTGARDLQGAMIKQSNANMRANALNDKRLLGQELAPAEEAEAAALRNLAAAIVAIRAASNVLEPNPPADYADNKYWPPYGV